MRLTLRLLAPLALLLCPVSADDHKNLGYTDTPVIPGQKWQVHDGKRPQPPEVEPGERFSHMAPPPADAVVLFDGSSLEHFQKGNGQPAGWKVENGYMEVVSGSGSIQTRQHFSDFQLHIEFATPGKVEGSSQGRGNSGVFIFGDFEVQILDSHRNPTYPDGQAGALYGQQPPMVNASLPPGTWQSYDIVFENARWDGQGNLVRKARVSVFHNGVLIHHAKEFLGPTRHKAVGRYGSPKTQGPISLQDHGNPTRFRNIWLRPIEGYDTGKPAQ